jgi:MFS family permease
MTVDLKGDATQGFWIGAGFLLACCISVPLTSHMLLSFDRRSMILSSIAIFGLGSLLGDYAEGMAALLAGRSVQGIGAGGLVLHAYAAYADMGHAETATRFLRGITCCTSLGMVSGPFVGAVVGAGSSWVR